MAFTKQNGSQHEEDTVHEVNDRREQDEKGFTEIMNTEEPSKSTLLDGETDFERLQLELQPAHLHSRCMLLIHAHHLPCMLLYLWADCQSAK
jgi:hypothetical protein